ncbi:hypothetical protein B0T20DRAFT_393593 [Sordaria brevicollis]|uniref:Uncharacterized protein n=1 Tax=Sordaria brevicollis TaxID=83679 RepID=A0AAE0PDF4_SORBR|nr:hypothetical protein B0T20DRAFT_393593 [Sordaria brevicollis]
MPSTQEMSEREELRSKEKDQGEQKRQSLEALTTWNRALKEYSRLPLESSENPARDRLAAISGVAESLSKQIGGCQQYKYIAGLWVVGDTYNYFAEQLLWRRVQHHDKSLSNDNPIELIDGALSWSWASISGAVEHTCDYNDEFDVVIDILEIKTELVDESCPFGAVKGGGSLRIRAPLLDSDMIPVGDDPIDRDLLTGNLIWESSGKIYLDSGTAGDYQLDVIEKRDIPDSKGLWFWLPVVYSQRNRQAMGLILEGVDDDDHGEDIFKRVGMFQIPEEFSAYDNEEALPDFQELFIEANGKDDGGPFPEWGPRRIITIM